MANKNQSNDLKTSLETIRQINWFDGIHKLPINVNKKLLDQCSDIIQEFIENSESLPTEIIESKVEVQKRQVTKAKKPKRKVTKIKQAKVNRKSQKIKSKVKTFKKNTQSFNYTNISPNNGCPCYPSAFPCFRSCGPINCPENKLPMPRDLWYRIVYSQVLEQQLGSGEAFSPQIQSVSSLESSSKRKYKEDESSYNNLHKNKLNDNNSPQQQTMNAAISSTSTKIVKFDVSLKVDDQLHRSDLEHPKIESEENLKKTLFTQSAHAELINRPKIHRGISADATLERIIPIPSAPVALMVLNNQSNSTEMIFSLIQPEPSSISIQQTINEITDDNSPVDSSVIFEHPLFNQLYEYYSLEDIPRFQLFKRLNRRLIHIHQTLKFMSLNDIELKLKYKRDALVKKRQTPVQSLTKDERIAMTELELNVYEYVKALDEPSSKYFHINNNDEIEIAPSVSTFNTVQLSVISQSTALLSTITQFSEKTEKLTSWNHPLEPNLMNMFEQLTPLRKAEIHKKLARRYEHICKNAKEFSKTQLQTQIDSKSKALEQSKKILQPNEDELLRIAELELCLFELQNEQTQRNSI